MDVRRMMRNGVAEKEKDIWHLEKLDIPYKDNPVKNVKSIDFTAISQKSIREELKKGIYLNLQSEAIACVKKEMTAIRRLSRYLKEKQPQIQSCEELNRNIIEEYLIYLKTEDVGMKYFHAELNRLRSILESIGHACEYENLSMLFLNRDIPPARRGEFRTYSDEELKRLNAAIVEMDEQTARIMIIHQMLGIRISDTLTLETDCLYEKEENIIIRIRQMKSNTYEKPVSAELAQLIRMAITYTREKYGETKYIWMAGRKNMNKYDKMVECNQKVSREKIDLARKTILDMMEEGEKVTIPKLMAQTGLSRGFFYKNPTVRNLLDEAMQKQVGMVDPRREILDMAMDNEIEKLHEQMKILRGENEELKMENQRMQKALEKKNANILRML